jgi:1-acyl-sn-glycerol-3-phosphate acyltransferase
MTKSVLGDDPFASGDEGKTPPPPEAPTEPKKAKKKAADASAVVEREARAPEPELQSEPAPSPSSAPPASAAPGAVPSAVPVAVPEVAATSAAPADDAEDTGEPDDADLGVEGAPPERDYGPPIDYEARRLPRQSLGDDLKEIERRFRQRFLPGAGESSERRQLPLSFVWKRWRELAMRDRSEVVDEFGRDPLYSARIQPLLEFLYSKYFRVEIQGLENIPDNGRALIVANHSGTLPYDGAMIMYAAHRDHPKKREVRPLVEDFVFHFPYLGTFINRIGGVRACQENAERLLLKDQLVAVFPEGIKGVGKLYKDRYRLQRFGRGGFIKLALRTGSPIIPTAVVGAEEIHPMLGKITWLAKSLGVPYLPLTPTFPWLGPLGLVPLPTKWYLRFGAPLYFNAEYGADSAEDRILVNRLSENVRSHIQEMIDVKLSQRRSVLLG